MPTNIGDVTLSEKGHSDVQLLPDDFEGSPHTGLAPRTKPKDHCSADKYTFCSKRYRSQHVLARSDPAIEVYLRPVSDHIDNARKHLDGRGSAVQLTTAVVRHDNRIGTVLNGELGVGLIQDPLTTTGPPKRS